MKNKRINDQRQRLTIRLRLSKDGHQSIRMGGEDHIHNDFVPRSVPAWG